MIVKEIELNWKAAEFFTLLHIPVNIVNFQVLSITLKGPSHFSQFPDRNSGWEDGV